tara:strand:+ start:107 stop:598 length:492 start_codon:yes stop_codon:yes gene_type:complete
MNYFKISLGILIVLAASRFIPHPPNFTSLLALSFYVPAIFGVSYIPAIVLSFFVTDLVIGFHGTTLFTWGSVILVGYMSKFFYQNYKNRIFGAIIGVLIFFIVTNFGVWVIGGYGYTLKGFVECYTLAIPFLGNNLISTLIFSIVIEGIINLKLVKNKLQKNI